MADSHIRSFRMALCAASAFGALTLAQAAIAQDSAAQPAAQPVAQQDEAADIVVTGIRGSLQSATNAKKNAVAFGDSIFAEEIGQLPELGRPSCRDRVGQYGKIWVVAE